MTVGQQMLSLACLWAVRGQLQLDAPLSDPLASDDACSTGGEGPEACHLGLLQKRQQMDVPDFEEAEEDFDTAFAEVPRDLGIFLSQAGDAAEGGAMAANSTLEGELTEAPRPKLALPVYWSSRRDIVGIERCYGANTGYCNALMYKARGACSGSSCVLIVNPPGHCTQTPLHIHAYHYNGRGAALKRQLSAKVCHSSGWQSGGFPCSGRAMYFAGFPAVFSVAQGAGSISHASVTAWPGSCGGGTIVLVSFHCSIEHSISQR